MIRQFADPAKIRPLYSEKHLDTYDDSSSITENRKNVGSLKAQEKVALTSMANLKFVRSESRNVHSQHRTYFVSCKMSRYDPRLWSNTCHCFCHCRCHCCQID